MRAVLRWGLRLGAIALAIALALGVAAVLLVDADAVSTWLRQRAADALGEEFGAEVEIASWRRVGGLVVEAEGVKVAIQGRPFAVVERVIARPAFPSLWPPALSIALEVAGFDARVGRGPDGRFDVDRLTLAADEEDEGEETFLTVTDVRFEVGRGRIRFEDVIAEPLTFTDIAGRGDVALAQPGQEELHLDRVDARIGELGLVLSGTLGLGGEQALQADVEARGRPGEQLARLAGVLPTLDLRAHASLSGTLENPTSELHAESDTASLDAETNLTTTASGDVLIESSWRVARVDPARLVPHAPAGELTGEGSISLAPALGLAGLRGEGRLHASMLADVRLEQLTARAHPVGDRLEFEVEAIAPAHAYATTATGAIDLHAPFTLSAKAELTLEDPSGLPGALPEWLADTRLRGRVEVVGRQPLEPARDLKLRIELDPGQIRGLPLTRAELHGELSGDLLRVEALDVVAERTRLRGTGQVELAPAGVVDARAEGPIDLRLVPGANASGVVDAGFTASGRLDALDARLRAVSADQVATPEVGGRIEASVDVHGLGSGKASGTIEARGDAAPRGALAEAIGEETRKVQLAATWSEHTTTARALRPAPWAKAGARSGWPPAHGRVATRATDHVHFSFTATEPDGRDQQVTASVLVDEKQTVLDIESLAIAPRTGDVWRLGRPAHAVIGRDSLVVQDFEMGSRGGVVRADGTLRSGAGRNDLRATVRGVDLSFACLLAGVQERCSGPIDLELTARGSGAAPEIDGRLEIRSPRIDEREYGDLHADLRADRRFRVALAIGDEREPDLRGEGSIGLTPGAWLPSIDWSGPIEGWARAAALPLDALIPLTAGALEDLDGRAAIDIRVGGTLDQPRPAGRAEITDLLVAVAATGATYRDGSALVLFTSDEIRVADLAFAGGSVKGGGAIALDGFAPDALDLWLELDDAPVLSRPEADGRANGRIVLQGRMAAPRLEGEIVVGPATIRPTLAGAGGGPELDPTIQVVRGGEEAEQPDDALGMLLAGQPAEEEEEPEEPAPRAEASFADDLAIRIVIRIGDGVIIRRTDAHLRLTGDLTVTKEPGGEVRVVGAIESTNGWYLFQGRRLEIERAAVRFGGEWPLDPDLEVRATGRSGGYDVTVQVLGTLSEPSLELSSSPPLDQGDILSVLLFGKPTSELSGSQGAVLQQQALGVLTAYVAPQLQRSLMDTLGLAAVTVSMPSGDRAGTVGVGRYFGNDLFVSLAQDFGGPKGGTQRQLQGLIGTSVTIQYSLTPSVTLQTASSTEGESSVDVIWRRRY